MSKTTGFRKIRAGGLDQGDVTLNRFGMIPIIQKSVGVSAMGEHRIAVVPDDGADILDILTLVDVDATGSAQRASLEFGTSADTTRFGKIILEGVGRYSLPVKELYQASADGTLFSAVGHALVAHVSGSEYTIASAGTHILVTVASASGDITAAPGFICYTTFLQPLGDS